MVEDVWLVIVWYFAITKGRKAAYLFEKKLRNQREPSWEDAIWEDSFWHWVANPMRVVGGLWVTLYLFDSAVRLGNMLEIPNMLPYSMMAQFDRGMYTLAAGVIAIMYTNHWLPNVLKIKAGVSDTSQQLVITRLVTVIIAFSTVGATALIFGVPAANLLGFGGIGGLTFGLAAKDLISNFIGGSMLAVMRPFSPGEKVYLMSVNGGADTGVDP